VTHGAALARALLVTLATPATWPLALAAFLLRGGIVVMALPIVVLPTPVGLGNVFAPTITSVALGSVPIAAVVATVAIAGGVVLWLVVGGWLAAAIEAEGARIVARDEDLAGMSGPRAPAVVPVGDGRIAARILTARLVAGVPLILGLAWGSVRLVFVTYRELTVPADTATPIVLRVLRASPEVVVVIVAAWMIGEIVGSVAARRIALDGDHVVAALRRAVSTSVRQPLATLARFWVPTIALLAVIAPSALAAGWASSAARDVLQQRADPLSVLIAVVVFVVLWVVGLVLSAVACAWRAAVWTVADLLGRGTFGGSGTGRPGDWRADTSSANL